MFLTLQECYKFLSWKLGFKNCLFCFWVAQWSDIMAAVHLHIDSAIKDGTCTHSGVQSTSASRAQQIYHVSATNDYRAVNWHTSPSAPYGRQRRRVGYYVWPTGIQGTSSQAIPPTSNMANEQLMTDKPLRPLLSLSFFIRPSVSINAALNNKLRRHPDTYGLSDYLFSTWSLDDVFKTSNGDLSELQMKCFGKCSQAPAKLERQRFASNISGISITVTDPDDWYDISRFCAVDFVFPSIWEHHLRTPSFAVRHNSRHTCSHHNSRSWALKTSKIGVWSAFCAHDGHDLWTWVRRKWKPEFEILGKVVAQSRF